jgi:hypothetical protein
VIEWVNSKLVRVWKEVAMPIFEALAWYLPGAAEKNTEILSQES